MLAVLTVFRFLDKSNFFILPVLVLAMPTAFSVTVFFAGGRDVSFAGGGLDV